MVKKIIRLGILLVVLCVAIAACKSTKSVRTEDFEEFYQKFITDENFQLSRIDFPLEGYETDGDTAIYWNSADDWTMLTGSIYDVDTTEYKVEKDYSPTEVLFKIYIENSGFSVTQEYELQDGKWYLVMYDSMSN